LSELIEKVVSVSVSVAAARYKDIDKPMQRYLDTCILLHIIGHAFELRLALSYKCLEILFTHSHSHIHMQIYKCN